MIITGTIGGGKSIVPEQERAMRASHALTMMMLAVCLAGSTAESGEGSTKRLTEDIIRESGVKAGLCVHLDVTDGRLTAELAESGKFVVHGLAPLREVAKRARLHMQSRSLHGMASVEHGSLFRLPYADNLVNLVVIDDLDEARRNKLSMEEVMRVLCPNGVAYVAGKKTVKPRPSEMDEWTHWLHGPECNNHSSDSLAGPAARLQWIDGPVWLTGPNITELFANGRSFNVMRVGRTKRARITARDAFNGLVLWERDIGTTDPRLIVAAGERVFAILEKDGPLVALDASSGEIVKKYGIEVSLRSILHVDGHLILGADELVCSVNVETGKVRWRKTAPRDAVFVLRHLGPAPKVLYKPPYMVSGNGQLFVFVKDAPQPPYSLVSYDLASGKERWRRKRPGEILAYYEKILLLYEVQSTTKPSRGGNEEKGTYHAVSSDNGRLLWDHQRARSGYHGVWDDPCYSGGFVWVGGQSLDPATGKKGRSFKTSLRGHCARIITTERYMYGAMGEITSFESGRNARPGWYKNGCNVGQIPANGLSYVFPISCSCIAYLRGYVAFAPAAAGEPVEADRGRAGRLEKGPAYGLKPRPAAAPEWNTYRHDTRRSGSTSEALGSRLKLLWSRTITDQKRTPHGRTITPPVIAEGMVFVAAPDSHQVCALDAETGKLRWRYPLGGRVEVPPTVFKGLCLFGANDGWVYALSAAAGEIVWRFRAAPLERRIVAYGRLESPWPVPGVLVEKDVAYFAAGRHSGSSGGVTVFAVDPFSGKVLWERRVDSKTTREVWYDNNANDLLVSDGAAIFMCQQKFDLETGERKRTWYKKKSYSHDYLLSGQGRDSSAVFPFGFLYDRRDGVGLERYHSTHWYYRGVRGYVLAMTGNAVFGVTKGKKPWSKSYWELFAKRPDDKGGGAPVWSTQVPAGSHALLLAGEVLFVAGPEGKADGGGMLWTYSAADGRRLSELRLGDVPVFDGMAAAGGRIYVSTQKGKVFCFGKK